MFEGLRGAAAAGLDVLYPRVCGGCGAAMGRQPGHLCWECRARLRLIRQPYCLLCGDPADGIVETRYICSTCRRNPPAFAGARSVARYRGELRGCLHAFKYGGATYLTAVLVDLLEAGMRAHYADLEFDCVTAVPLHPVRLRKRGYNQSELLARALARRLALPYAANCLARTRRTRSQTDLTAPQRRENVVGAFRVQGIERCLAARLLVVDDVMTTGATVRECAGVLRRAGSLEVFVITVARG